MRPRIGFPMLSLAGLLGAGELWAHHSLMSEFDVNRSIELRGRVTRLVWSNPHITLYLEVDKESAGQADAGKHHDSEIWECELGSPNPLIQAGWNQEDLPVDSELRVIANPARDGSPTCSTRNLRLEDGTPIFTRYREPSS